LCGSSILICCPRNLHRHEWALKDEEEANVQTKLSIDPTLKAETNR